MFIKPSQQTLETTKHASIAGDELTIASSSNVDHRAMRAKSAHPSSGTSHFSPIETSAMEKRSTFSIG
jgi:hypothetical protein